MPAEARQGPIHSQPVRNDRGITLLRVFRRSGEALFRDSLLHAVSAGDGVPDKLDALSCLRQRRHRSVGDDPAHGHQALGAFAQLHQAYGMLPTCFVLQHCHGFLVFGHPGVQRPLPVHIYSIPRPQVQPRRIAHGVVRLQRKFHFRRAVHLKSDLAQGGHQPQHAPVFRHAAEHAHRVPGNLPDHPPSPPQSNRYCRSSSTVLKYSPQFFLINCSIFSMSLAQPAAANGTPAAFAMSYPGFRSSTTSSSSGR